MSNYKEKRRRDDTKVKGREREREIEKNDEHRCAQG